MLALLDETAKAEQEVCRTCEDGPEVVLNAEEQRRHIHKKTRSRIAEKPRKRPSRRRKSAKRKIRRRPFMTSSALKARSSVKRIEASVTGPVPSPYMIFVGACLAITAAETWGLFLQGRAKTSW